MEDLCDLLLPTVSDIPQNQLEILKHPPHSAGVLRGGPVRPADARGANQVGPGQGVSVVGESCRLDLVEPGRMEGLVAFFTAQASFLM